MRVILLVLVTACQSTAPAPQLPRAPAMEPSIKSAHGADGPPMLTMIATSPNAALCGFPSFAAFRDASWQVAKGYNYVVQREPGDLRKWPDGAPPPLGPPPPVGSCFVHAIDPLITLYEVRDGDRSIAVITLESMVLRVTGFSVEGVSVSTPSSDVVAHYPPARFRPVCASGRFGSICWFDVIGTDNRSAVTYYVDGELPFDEPINGAAALQFLAGKVIRAIELDAPRP